MQNVLLKEIEPSVTYILTLSVILALIRIVYSSQIAGCNAYSWNRYFFVRV